jgi:glycosyltransferase domain-containing protein
MNRIDFVIRQLNYYKVSQLEVNIYIGDSSSVKNWQLLLSAINTLGMKNITVYHNKELSVTKTVQFLLKKIDTKYVTIIGDDDFFINSGLKASIEFLENNNEYIACHGKSFVISTIDDCVYGQINGLYPYQQPILESDDLSYRLHSFAKKYSTPLFVVHRTEIFKKMYINCEIDDKRFSEELLPSFIGPVIGKYKEIDKLYMVRQTHAQRYLLPTVSDWVFSKDWLRNYNNFKNILSNTIVLNNRDISIQNANKMIDELMGTYLETSRKNTSNEYEIIIKKLIFKFKIIGIFYQKYLNIFNKKIDKGLLHKLSTNQIYQKDFIEFKRFIENGHV